MATALLGESFLHPSSLTCISFDAEALATFLMVALPVLYPQMADH